MFVNLISIVVFNYYWGLKENIDWNYLNGLAIIETI